MYHSKGYYTQLLQQHQHQQQQRLHVQQHQAAAGGRGQLPATSPTAPSATSPGVDPAKSNNLAVSPVSGVNQRVPSPQEMAIHAQQILQNALIKRKLKEQEENYRRRQEHDSKEHNRNSPSNLPFTPTVVMKKMAADRRDSDPKIQPHQGNIPELKINQDNSAPPPLGANLNINNNGGSDNKRPHELKLDHPLHPEAVSPTRTSPISPSLLFRLQMQEQQNMQAAAAMAAAGVGAGPPRGYPPNPNPQDQHQLLIMQQMQAQRAQHMAALQQAQRHPDPRMLMQLMSQGGHHTGGPPPGPQGFPPQGSQQQQLGQRPIPPMPAGPQRFMHPGMMPGGAGMGGGPPGGNPHLQHPGVGPDQPPQQSLSRFFSPEVLAQAQAGNAPPLPPLPTQKAMTLEEIERQAAAVKI